ncbi:MAG: DUF4860 domain-containing protein [Clostridia bacterium]|nr:DUF4860 domain-containing protein [Clostridia bacterium]
MVVLLILALCFSAVVLMDAGRKAYSRILENNSRLTNARIALSYVNMRIRQNDFGGVITYEKNFLNGSEVLVIEHTGIEKGMYTYIFYSGGALWEIYIPSGVDPGMEDAERIVEVEGFAMDYHEEGNFFRISAAYSQDGKIKTMERIIGKKTG